MPPLARPTKPRHPVEGGASTGGTGGTGAPVGAPHRQHEGTTGRGCGEGAEPEGQQRLDPADAGQHADHHHQHPEDGGDGQPAPHHLERGLPPREGGGHGHQEEQGQPDGNEEPVEVRCPHPDLGAVVEGLVEEWEDRPQEHHEGEPHEEDVVGQEGPLAAHRRIDAAHRAEPVAPPGDQPHPGAQDQPEEPQQQGADGRLRERVHRLDDPGAGQEGPEDGQAERRHHQRQVPDPEESAALLHHHRVQVGRAHQPGQEGGVLDRIPPPEPAPAEDLVGPPRSEQDPHGEEGPGEQGPPPGLPLPVLVEPARDQRGDGEGEGQREPDQAEVEHGRVDEDQRVVLEQRIGAWTVGRDGTGHMLEGVGRPQHQPEEEGGHHVDHQRGPRHQGVARPPSEPPDHGGGVAAQHRSPEQDGAGQGRPQPGDGVEPRRRATVVGGHVGEREVVGEQGVLHGHHGDDASHQDQGGIDPARHAWSGRGPWPGRHRVPRCPPPRRRIRGGRRCGRGTRSPMPARGGEAPAVTGRHRLVPFGAVTLPGCRAM